MPGAEEIKKLDFPDLEFPKFVFPDFEVLMKASLGAAVGVYVVAALAAAAVCFFLPVETRGRELRDHHKHPEPAARR